MAKELWIVFVYDTLRCTEEEDDPQDALLYFHPAWVNDQHRLALCGQLMGTAQFFVSTFTCPRLMALDSGKFVLSRCGRYFLVVGTDRNIPDWVLEHRAATLQDILQFYHCDLETVVDIAGAAVKEKLVQIFDTYLPMLQYASNLLGVIPSIRLPKSAGNVFLEAMQILQACQEVEGVFGGAVIYENRVVASQFSCGLTKRLVATDPHHIKPAADTVETPFHLPVGVQLLTVYLDRQEFARLSKESFGRKLAVENTILKRFIHRKLPPTKIAQTPKEVTSSMKRDTSRIFTVVEEKEGEMEHSEELPFIHNGGEVDMPVLHSKVMSICRSVDQPVLVSPLKSSINGEPSPERKCANGRLEVLLDQEEGRVRSQSLADVRHPLKSVRMRCYSLGLPKLTRNMCGEEEEDSPSANVPGRHFYNTITDPLFPVFRSDGLSVSRALFDEYLERHYKLLDRGKGVVSPVPAHREKRAKSQDVYRRSLSLPLKTFTMDEVDDGVDTRRRSTSYTSDTDSPAVRVRPLGSLQLTPLMSRLSLLAEDKTSGFCSRDTTPSEVREIPDLVPDPTRPLPVARKMEESQDQEVVENGRNSTGNEKMVLYVYGQQDMVLLVLLGEQSAQDPELIHSLWELSVTYLGLLERHLHKCLDHFPQGEGLDSYSFLCLDSAWDMLQRGGRWSSTHLDVVGCLHQNFNSCPALTEVMVRCEDSVVYGYQCGETQVFYQQSVGHSMGLPAPSDMMGIVPLKARRRLERDHGIVLL